VVDPARAAVADLAARRARPGRLFAVFYAGLALVPIAIAQGFLAARREATSWLSHEPRPIDDLFGERPPPRPRLERLRKYDPNFSEIALEDYLHELYARAMRSRTSDDELALLAPFLSASVRGQLRTRGQRSPAAVGGIVVGSSRVHSLHVGREPIASVQVDFEANYEETPPGGGPKVGYWVRERWTMQRNIAATSRPPTEVRAFGCPSCGAPVEHDQREACRHCGTRWDTGDFEWQCTKIHVQEENVRPPALGGYSEEQGTFASTIVEPECDRMLAELARLDPAGHRDVLRGRIGTIYRELNLAWSSLEWEKAKPICTDRFWLAQTYWIEAYKANRLRNRMEQARLRSVEFAKVRIDPFYWAVTVRIRAEAIDITVAEPSGHVVGGNAIEPREYAEYWTVVRPVPGTTTDKPCPSCGAPLVTNLAGNCEHCGVKVSGGASDWVLSKIEQDEAYLG